MVKLCSTLEEKLCLITIIALLYIKRKYLKYAGGWVGWYFLFWKKIFHLSFMLKCYLQVLRLKKEKKKVAADFYSNAFKNKPSLI